MKRPFYEQIRENYKVFDTHMMRHDEGSLMYRLMLIMRSAYCVNVDLDRHKGTNTLKKQFRAFIKTFAVAVLYPFFTIVPRRKAESMVLPVFAVDIAIADYLNIPLLEFDKKVTFRPAAIIDLFQTYFKLFRISLLPEIKFQRVFLLAGDVAAAYKYSHEADLSGIRLISCTDDVSPVQVGVLLNAKRNAIARLKYEYAQINSLMGDNVFADHYFYPTTLHLKIRQASPMNKDLKYIEGGYVNLNRTEEDQHTPYVPEKLITYFTGHSDLYEFDDHYYIGQILEQKPVDHKLAVKVHPYDHVEDYNYLHDREDVTIYAFDDIRNGELINRSAFCISQDSAMSFEAKLTCVNSYFTNYTWRNCCYTDDFEYMSEYFDFIDSPELLHRVLHGEHTPKSISVFKQNVDMTYPHTLQKFQQVIENILCNTKTVI